jgi:hypothetical protein
MALISSGDCTQVSQSVAVKANEWTNEITGLALVIYVNRRFSVLLQNVEWPMLCVTLHVLVLHFSSNQTLGIENGIFGVRMECVFGAIPDTTKALTSKTTM